MSVSASLTDNRFVTPAPGKPAVPLTPGTIIEIPEGIKHWHGAAADSWMQHLALHKDVQPGSTNEWLEPVSDEQYKSVR